MAAVETSRTRRISEFFEISAAGSQSISSLAFASKADSLFGVKQPDLALVFESLMHARSEQWCGRPFPIGAMDIARPTMAFPLSLLKCEPQYSVVC